MCPLGDGDQIVQKQTRKQALVILPGLTADKVKRDSMLHFFTENTPYAVYVPDIPKRRSLKRCAQWLGAYLDQIVRPERYQGIQVLAYISGGFVFRQMSSSHPVRHLEHVVYVRSPIQELTLGKFRERYGYLLLWMLRGQLALDIVALDQEQLEFPPTGSGQGVIVETGISKLARSMGISREQVPAAAWEPGTLLPGANDVIRVPESHDDVYTSTSVLGQASYFFTHRRFRKSPEHGQWMDHEDVD